MTMSTLSSRLSDEERAFLKQLFQESAADQSNPERSGEIELEALGAGGRRLLEMLQGKETVLLAEDEQQLLRFKISIVPSPFGEPERLRVSAPLVSERLQVDQGGKKPVAKTADQ